MKAKTFVVYVYDGKPGQEDEPSLYITQALDETSAISQVRIFEHGSIRIKAVEYKPSRGPLFLGFLEEPYE